MSVCLFECYTVIFKYQQTIISSKIMKRLRREYDILNQDIYFSLLFMCKNNTTKTT